MITHATKSEYKAIAAREQGLEVTETTAPDGKTVYGWTSHEGAVLSIFSKSVRIMSDVWGRGTYARVWTGNGYDEVALAFDDMSYEQYATATVDATPEVLAEVAAYEARLQAAREARIAAEREAHARAECTGPRKGATLRVVKGRKVPVGTVGKCIWYGSGRYGDRVGIKVDGREDPYWTAASNCEAVVDDRADGETWVDYRARKASEGEARRIEASAASPEKGDEVTLVEGVAAFTVGTVFWKRAYPSGSVKMGVARKGAVRRSRGGYSDSDVAWVWSNDIATA